MVSNARDDFPDPDRPVITVILLRGILTEMFFRLCSRAPFMNRYGDSVIAFIFRAGDRPVAAFGTAGRPIFLSRRSRSRAAQGAFRRASTKRPWPGLRRAIRKYRAKACLWQRLFGISPSLCEGRRLSRWVSAPLTPHPPLPAWERGVGHMR